MFFIISDIRRVNKPKRRKKAHQDSGPSRYIIRWCESKPCSRCPWYPRLRWERADPGHGGKFIVTYKCTPSNSHTCDPVPNLAIFIKSIVQVPNLLPVNFTSILLYSILGLRKLTAFLLCQLVLYEKQPIEYTRGRLGGRKMGAWQCNWSPPLACTCTPRTCLCLCTPPSSPKRLLHQPGDIPFQMS